MKPSAFRFRPPSVEITPGVRWVLRRAFGPLEEPGRAAAPVRGVFDSARSLDLAARIAVRSDPDRLAAEIGGEAADFIRESGRCADEAVLHGLAAQDVALAARELSIPLVLLKFQALLAAGHIAAGARGTSDVDVLVPAGCEERLRRSLLERGFRPSGSPDYEHETSAVLHPFGISVDIHRKLVGVRPAGSRSADARALLGRGLCVPRSDLPGEPSVPGRAVLIAHALVHGIAQNGLAPQAYPLLRMIGDLIDLDFDREEADSPWEGWISRDVSEREIAAVAGLCRRLRSGGNIETAEPDERAFLGHVVAAAVDPKYSRSLAVRRMFHEPTDHSRAGKVVRTLLRALVPPGRAAGRGSDGGRWRRIVMRVARPWVLLGRALR